MKSALPSAVCRAVHTALCGNRRGPRNPCAITAGLLIAWPCAQSHLAAPVPQERATQPCSPQAKAEGFPSLLCVIGSSRKCQWASTGTTLPGLPCWQQCSESGSHWERTGLLYPLFVKLRLQRTKNHLFTGAKADECSTMHLAPDHSRAFPTFLSLSERECWFLKNFHTDLGDTRLPCPFSFCAAIDFNKTYLLGGLIPGS